MYSAGSFCNFSVFTQSETLLLLTSLLSLSLSEIQKFQILVKLAQETKIAKIACQGMAALFSYFIELLLRLRSFAREREKERREISFIFLHSSSPRETERDRRNEKKRALSFILTSKEKILEKDIYQH